MGFSLKLWSQRRAGDAQLRYYWLTVLSTMVLIAADSLEYWASKDPGLRFWRILFSVIGYVMRPTAALSIVLIIYPEPRRPRYLWIPCIVNTLIYCTAFFSPIAFGFGAKYNFLRGPLGYSVFVVSFLYILYIVWMTWKRFKDRDHRRERLVLYTCAVACMISSQIDMHSEGNHVNAAIMVSSVFLYMFLRSYETNRDPLTKLLNLQSFYEDSAQYSAAVTAVSSVDMNGLKSLNDSQGHEKGDEALKAIGKCLDKISGKNTLAYRIGGDEFALLFIRQEENAVSETLKKLKTLTEEEGYTVSTGYAMRLNKEESIKDLLRISDECMYADKEAHYRMNQHDRRRGR